MGTTITDRQRIELEEIKAEYGLTEKQARFVQATVEAPEAPVLTRAINAGYHPTGVQKNAYKSLKGTRIKGAIKGQIVKRANLKVEMQKLESDPRGYLKERFIENASDPTITAVMHASLESVAKLEGLYTTKLEVDVGEKTRAAWALSRIPQGLLDDSLANLSQE